jgi:hypothetical protein
MKKAKVQIVETSNKNIKVGDKFKVNISGEKGNVVKGKGGTGGGGKRKPKQPSLRDIVVQFIVKQEAFNNEVVSFIKEQRQFNAKQEQFNNKIESKLDNVIKLNDLKS